MYILYFALHTVEIIEFTYLQLYLCADYPVSTAAQKSISSERGHIVCHFDSSVYFVGLRISNIMHHILGNCVYCTVLFCEETLTVIIDSRQYAVYLNVS